MKDELTKLKNKAARDGKTAHDAAKAVAKATKDLAEAAEALARADSDQPVSYPQALK